MMSIVEAISQRLKVVRKAAGFNTAKSFAESQGIPVTTYCQHESGKRSLNIESLINYSTILKIEPTWLLTGEGSPCNTISNKKFESRILEEIDKIENHAGIVVHVAPLISDEHQYSTVNIGLLKKILLSLMPLMTKIPDCKKSESIEFCLDLYNKIISSNSTGAERINLIKISLDSYFSGMGVKVSESTIKNLVVND